MDIKIRKGIKSDLPSVLALIKELADYENALDQVDVTLSQLEKDGFEGNPYYYLLVAEENMDGLHWQVLDWNTPALNFYKKYNATISSTWLNGRLNKEQIKNIKDLV